MSTKIQNYINLYLFQKEQFLGCYTQPPDRTTLATIHFKPMGNNQPEGSSCCLCVHQLSWVRFYGSNQLFDGVDVLVSSDLSTQNTRCLS